MMSHIVSVGTESMEWISFGMIAQEKSMIPSVNPTRFEKLLGFAPPAQDTATENAMPLQYVHQLVYMEDDMADILEEDVWGDDDDDTSSFGDEATMPSSKHWPDSESDSHFSAFFADDVGKSRFAGIFTPSQFSPSDREAMCGRQFYSSCITSSQHGASGSVNQAHDTMATSPHHGILLSNKNFSPGYGPRSAPVEVPVWTRLCAMTKHGNNFLHVEDDEDDNVVVERVPPHELLAKQHARSQISAFSVIEGAGRTLKGRDVSKVRDAVWKQTGFYG